MEKLYQVFVSSTFSDLKSEREAVIRRLLKAGYFPAGMEMFHASNETPWEKIQRVIIESDYYIVILAGRYGTLDEDGISFTEKEYKYAVENKIPVAGFIHKDIGCIPLNKVDTNQSIIQKRDRFFNDVKVLQCSFWSDINELCDEIMNSLHEATTNNPRPGWTRNKLHQEHDLGKSVKALRHTETLTASVEAIQKRLHDAQNIIIHFGACCVNPSSKPDDTPSSMYTTRACAHVPLKHVFSTIAAHMLVFKDEEDIFFSASDEIESILISSSTIDNIDHTYIRPSDFSDVFLALTNLQLIEPNTTKSTLKWKLSKDGLTLFAHERSQMTRINV